RENIIITVNTGNTSTATAFLMKNAKGAIVSGNTFNTIGTHGMFLTDLDTSDITKNTIVGVLNGNSNIVLNYSSGSIGLNITENRLISGQTSGKGIWVQGAPV